MSICETDLENQLKDINIHLCSVYKREKIKRPKEGEDNDRTAIAKGTGSKERSRVHRFISDYTLFLPPSTSQRAPSPRFPLLAKR